MLDDHLIVRIYVIRRVYAGQFNMCCIRNLHYILFLNGLVEVKYYSIMSREREGKGERDDTFEIVSCVTKAHCSL